MRSRPLLGRARKAAWDLTVARQIVAIVLEARVHGVGVITCGQLSLVLGVPTQRVYKLCRRMEGNSAVIGLRVQR